MISSSTIVFKTYYKDYPAWTAVFTNRMLYTFFSSQIQILNLKGIIDIILLNSYLMPMHISFHSMWACLMYSIQLMKVKVVLDISQFLFIKFLWNYTDWNSNANVFLTIINRLYCIDIIAFQCSIFPRGIRTKFKPSLKIGNRNIFNHWSI